MVAGETSPRDRVKGEWAPQSMMAVAAVAVLGSGVAVYSLWHHIKLKANGSTDAACNINATVNCDAVAQSPYGELLGLPLGAWGLAYFLTLLWLGVSAGSGKGSGTKPLGPVVAGFIWLGVAASVGLAAVSAVLIKALCLSCLGIYLCNLVLALIAWRERRSPAARPDWMPFLQGCWRVVPGLVLSLGLMQGLKSMVAAEEPELTSMVGDGGPARAILAGSAKAIPVARSAYTGLGEDYRRGSDNAKVTLVVFSDFQCPACRGMSETLEVLGQEYGERVQVVYRNYPLDNSCNASLGGPMHTYACKLAVLARCAGQFGKFWPYHNLAFARQAQLKEGAPEAWAEEVGLSASDVSACLASKSILEKVQDDIKLGNELNVDATPSLYLNGHKVLQNNIAALRAEIDKALQQ